ncbi:MAG: sensory histidine kinase DcuS [Methanoregulaceae archaeon PtaU1.Bin222]|nr:MAG: sensory histidine kinase DcuS [Methanoregulaceae archaeon PtaU1.Bin222]
MLIRKKVIAAIILLVLILGLAILGSMQLVLIPTRDRIEAIEAEEKVSNAMHVVEYELDSLRATGNDWSAWDDTYYFTQDHSQPYIDNNLMNNTFTSLKVDLMMYYDLNGTLLYGKGYDYIELRPFDTPESLNSAESIIGQIHDLPEDSTYSDVQGILSLPEGVLLFSLNPIIKSDYTGPVAGYLLIGRYLDETEVDKIATLTSTNLTIFNAMDEESSLYPVPQALLEGKSPSFVEISDDNNRIFSYGLMRDVFDKPAIILKVDSERLTYQASQQSMILFVVIIAGIGCAAVLAVLFILDRDIFSRLSYLERSMKDIAESRDFSKRIESSGDDEVTSLSSGINLTLIALEEHIRSERGAVQSAWMANEKLTLLSKITSHDVLNQVTVIRGFTDLTRDSLPVGAPAIRYLDRIAEASISIEDQLGFTREYLIGGSESAPAWFNVSELVRRVTLKMPLGAVKVEDECGDLEIFTDPLFHRIVYNLVDNSLSHGEKVTRIRFLFRSEGEEGVLTYEDDGIGIPYEEKEHIFMKGFGKHKGLGLFLTRGILAISNISIRENGIPGQGARFELRIPKGFFRIPGKWGK